MSSRLIEMRTLFKAFSQMNSQHAYDSITLFSAGMVLGIILIVVHAVMLLRPQITQAALKKFPRHMLSGQILLGLGLAWFWLLIAPENLGKLSFLCMDLGEFNGAKPLLRIIVPLALVGVTISVRDFLAVRALGLLGLLAATPLLESAFLEDPISRLLIPIYTYGMLTASLFCVGMPYLFRDLLAWVSAKPIRWQILSAAGLCYGVAVVSCALFFWRGY